jgi:hypothetical protein
MSPDTYLAPHEPLPAQFARSLCQRGFVRDGRVYRKDGLTFARSGQWCFFTDENIESETCLLSRDLGQPGLWKGIQNGRPPYRIFEIPAWAISEPGEDDHWDATGPAAFDKLVDWALATRHGQLPVGWVPPDADLVKSWLSSQALTVERKGYARQGEWILNSNRWALRLPILPRLPEDLPAARRHALDELIREGQHHWSMVRMGVPADLAPATMVAEVDFTGAPPSEPLFSAGLDALKHGVAWLVETADVLADPKVAIRCLSDGTQTNLNERNLP